MSIRLHSKLGVNPRLVKNKCVLCEELYDSNELVLMGASNKKFVCNECGTTSYGSTHCLKNQIHRGQAIELDEFEPIIANKLSLCPSCAKEQVIILHHGCSGEYIVLPISSFNITPPKDGIMQADDETWKWLVLNISSDKIEA